MRKLLLGISLAVLALSSAQAADIAKKAPTAETNPFLTYTGSGFYWGVGTSSGVDQASVNGNVFATSLVSSNLIAAGQSVDLEGGYIWGNSNLAGFANWARVYASGSYQNITGGFSVPGNSAGFASRWSAQEGFDVNADIVAAIFTAIKLGNPLPTFTPQLPSGVAVASTPHQYVGAFFTEFGVTGNFGQANGVEVATAPGVRSGYLWQTVDATGKPNGGALDIGVQIAWPLKGVTFDNVFAANGTPLAVNAGISAGTQYKAYVRYDF